MGFFIAFLYSIYFVHVQSTMFSSSPDPFPQLLSPEYCPFLISNFIHTYLIYILYIYTYYIYLYTYLCKLISIICSIVYERSMQYLYLWLSLCHLAWWSWVLSVCGVILQFMADYTLTMLVYQFSFPILLFKNYYFFLHIDVLPAYCCAQIMNLRKRPPETRADRTAKCKVNPFVASTG